MDNITDNMSVSGLRHRLFHVLVDHGMTTDAADHAVHKMSVDELKRQLDTDAEDGDDI